MIRRLGAVAILLGLLASCHESGPVVGGETNWLRACTEDAECGDQACLCGVCTVACADAACPAGRTCARSTSAAWDELCSSHQDPPLCVPSCEADPCPDGSICRDGGCVPTGAAARRQLAFPGAEGFGARSRGGRGGRVVKVTTLAADGPGSLAAALALEEPRTIVFDVSGVIDAPVFEVPFGNVTVAGQTAPGAGITLRGRLHFAYDYDVGHIIIRYLRLRPEYDGSDVAQFDAIQLGRNHHVILDHVSAGFGVDETIDVYDARDVTIQWSTIETPNDADNPVDPFIRGIVAGTASSRVSVHHTFCSHSGGSCVALAGGPAELVSSHFYDVRAAFSHSDVARGLFQLRSNTFRGGPGPTLLPLLFDDESAEPDPELAYYIDDNVLLGETDDCPAGNVDDPWGTCTYSQGGDASLRSSSPPDFVALAPEYVTTTITPSADTTDAVLARAGALPHDVVTRTAVADARAGTGVIGGVAPADLLDGLAPEEAPVDTDADGMPDTWETDAGLDPNDPADQNDLRPSGFTAIEEYLNELAAQLDP